MKENYILCHVRKVIPKSDSGNEDEKIEEDVDTSIREGEESNQED